MKEPEDRPAQKFYISSPSIGYMKKTPENITAYGVF
jgi:hypothetical protein